MPSVSGSPARPCCELVARRVHRALERRPAARSRLRDVRARRRRAGSAPAPVGAVAQCRTRLDVQGGGRRVVAGDVSFDVVSDFDQQELVNALDQARREIGTRYDFKGAKAEIELGKDEIIFRADNEFARGPCATCSSPRQSGVACRSRSSTGATIEEAGGNTVRQTIRLKRGLPGRSGQEDHQAHPRRLPQAQVADPGQRRARQRQEQG